MKYFIFCFKIILIFVTKLSVLSVIKPLFVKLQLLSLPRLKKVEIELSRLRWTSCWCWCARKASCTSPASSGAIIADAPRPRWRTRSFFSSCSTLQVAFPHTSITHDESVFSTDLFTQAFYYILFQ
jgi:hypothetical protein